MWIIPLVKLYHAEEKDEKNLKEKTKRRSKKKKKSLFIKENQFLIITDLSYNLNVFMNK